MNKNLPPTTKNSWNWVAIAFIRQHARPLVYHYPHHSLCSSTFPLPAWPHRQAPSVSTYIPALVYIPHFMDKDKVQWHFQVPTSGRTWTRIQLSYLPIQHFSWTLETAWVQIPALKFIHYGTLDNFFNFPVLQFVFFLNKCFKKDNTIYLSW